MTTVPYLQGYVPQACVHDVEMPLLSVCVVVTLVSGKIGDHLPICLEDLCPWHGEFPHQYWLYDHILHMKVKCQMLCTCLCRLWFPIPRLPPLAIGIHEAVLSGKPLLYLRWPPESPWGGRKLKDRLLRISPRYKGRAQM